MVFCPPLLETKSKMDQSNVNADKTRCLTKTPPLVPKYELSACASVLEKLSVKKFDSRYLEAFSAPASFPPGLRSSSTLICSA